MIHRIAVRLSEALSDKLNADERARQIYCYGIEVLLSNLTTMLTVLLIGQIMGILTCSILYLAIYSSLKVTCGGYHARTQLACWLISIASFVATVVMAEVTMLLPVSRLPWIIVLVLSTIYILLSPPVMNSNHPVAQKTVKKNKKISTFLISVYTLIIGGMYFVTDGYFLLNFLVLTILSVAIGIFIAQRKE